MPPSISSTRSLPRRPCRPRRVAVPLGRRPGTTGAIVLKAIANICKSSWRCSQSLTGAVGCAIGLSPPATTEVIAVCVVLMIGATGYGAADPYHARSTAATRCGRWSKMWLPLRNLPRGRVAVQHSRQPTRVTRFNCSGHVPVHWALGRPQHRDWLTWHEDCR